jgi:NAD(P)-dependent dehydrogenase (short-subunit alcohol dehydrogenase family)
MHVLVANSGLRKDAAVADMTLDDWRTVIDINLTGQFLSCRTAVPQAGCCARLDSAEWVGSGGGAAGGCGAQRATDVLSD